MSGLRVCLPVVFLACQAYACLGGGKAATLDSGESPPVCSLPGRLGSAPVRKFGPYAADPRGYPCPGSPWIGGIAHPLSDDGFLIEGGARPCCTDVAASSISRVSASGELLWTWDEAGNEMSGPPGLPRLFAIQDGRFVVVRQKRDREMDVDRYSLEGFLVDQTSAWTLSASALGDPRRLAHVVRPDAADLEVLATYADGPSDAVPGLFRVAHDGAIAGPWKHPEARGWPVAQRADDDGVSFVTVRNLDGESGAGKVVTWARIGWDGTLGGPHAVGTWKTSGDGTSPHVQVWSPGTGFVVTVVSTGSKPDFAQKVETIRLDADGSVRWRHDGWWHFPDGDNTLQSGTEEADGRLRISGGAVSDATEQTVWTGWISADGSAFELERTYTIASPVPGSPWHLLAHYPVDGGPIGLALVPTSAEATAREVRVVRWDDGYAKVRWSRSYGLTEGYPTLARTGDAWLLSMNVEKPWDDCFMNDTAAAIVLERFEGVCP